MNTTAVNLVGTWYCTRVLMGRKKAMFLKIHYFHILVGPLRRKIHTHSKSNLKTFHTILEGSEFLIELSQKMIIQTFKCVWEKAGLEQVAKKVPPPRAVSAHIVG